MPITAQAVAQPIRSPPVLIVLSSPYAKRKHADPSAYRGYLLFNLIGSLDGSAILVNTRSLRRAREIRTDP